MHVGIVAQQDNPRAVELADDIRHHLDTPVSLDAVTAASLDLAGSTIESLEGCDLVVSIGGDGTFLFTAQHVAPTPIIGVNLGRVGFLNVVSPDEAVNTISEEVDRIQRGEASFQELPQVEATSDSISLPPAINEIAVVGTLRGHNQGIDLDIRVDGKQYFESHADGVLISTPTGSSAYNLSEGGPLVHPTVSALLITPMCAKFGMPPVVISGDAVISVRMANAPKGHVIADGRTREEVPLPASVTLRRAPYPIRIAGPPLDFFNALDKLE